MKTLFIIVKGLVQGVGFRYFCYKIALVFGVYGYAKNLDNGNVEVLIQGDEDALNGFIKEIKTGPRNAFVKAVEIKTVESPEIYKSFDIK